MASQMHSQSSATPQKIDASRKGFLDLPPEIRNIIYSLALIRRKGHARPYDYQLLMQTGNRFVYRLAGCLLRTCRQIRVEATPVLFGENIFAAEKAERVRSFLDQVPASVNLIRKVDFSWHASQMGTRQMFTLCKQLSNLDVLSILIRDLSLNSEQMAEALTPLLRAIHKARKGTERKQAIDVLVFRAHSNADIQEKQAAKVYGERVKGVLREVLK